MQAVFGDFGIVVHDLFKRRLAAVMHIRRGSGGVAQAWHAEFAPVLRGQPDVAGEARRGAELVVIERAEQVETVFAQKLDTAVAALVDPARLREMGQADIVKFAIGEIGTEMTEIAAALADKQFEAAPGGFRVAGDARRIFRCERVAERIERRLPGYDSFLKRGERFGDIDHDGLRLMGGGCRAKDLPVAIGKRRCGCQPGFQGRGRHAQFPRIQDRRDALRPQAVRFTVPAEPPVQPHVEQRRGIAVDTGDAETAWDAVGKRKIFLMAGRATPLPADG